jgi:hypothetical protein
LDELLFRLANHWRTHGAAPGSGAPEAEIVAFEVRHGVRLPRELRAYFATLNGMAHGRNDMDNETIGFWRLAEVAPIAEEAPDAGIPEPDRCFVIADYLIGSHFYVARLPDDPTAPAELLWVWSNGFERLAASFAEFVERYMAGDEAVLYGSGIA